MLYLRKICSWDIGQNALNQSDCRSFKSTISPQLCHFLQVDTDWQNLKFDQIFFWLGVVKNWHGQFGLLILKLTYLKNELIELTDFLHAVKNSGKLNVIENFWDGHGQKWIWPVWWWDFKIDSIWKNKQVK